MDISKLPRLSQTTAPAPAEPAPAAAEPLPPEAGFPVIPTAAAATQPFYCSRCATPNPATSRYCNGCGAELRPAAQEMAYVAPVGGPGIGAEVWLSAIVGVVLMLLGMNFGRWAIITLVGGVHETGLTWGAPVPGQPNQRPEGSPIGYWELPGFTALTEAGTFLFGLAMVLEAVVLLAVHSRVRAKRPLLVFALAITLAATALNLFVAVKLFGVGLLPIMSLLAVGFGGYIAVYEWGLLQHFRRAPQTR